MNITLKSETLPLKDQLKNDLQVFEKKKIEDFIYKSILETFFDEENDLRVTVYEKKKIEDFIYKSILETFFNEETSKLIK